MEPASFCGEVVLPALESPGREEFRPVPSKIRFAGLLIGALIAASCTTSAPEPSRSARSPQSLASPSPSVSPSPVSHARTTSVQTFQLASRSFGVAIVRRCLATDPSSCHQRLVAT
jgi:hypothetical protein